MSFDHLGLRAELLKAVKTKCYTTPTLIQTGVIPVILNGRDILARPRALVLTPTRELALQVGACIKDYARKVSL